LLETNSTINLHPTALNGTWTFCLRPRGDSIWTPVDHYTLVISSPPTFNPKVGNAGSPIPVRFSGEISEGDLVVMHNSSSCLNAHVTTMGPKALSKQVVENSIIYTAVAMNRSGNVFVCYASNESKGSYAGDFALLPEKFMQADPPIFSPIRMVEGATQRLKVEQAVMGDKFLFTLYNNCSAEHMYGPETPAKSAVYNITNAPIIGPFSTQVVKLHASAAPGKWRFCLFMRMTDLWLTVVGKTLTIIPKPTYHPTIAVAGSITPLTMFGAVSPGDFVVMQYGGCVDAHRANTTRSSHTKQALTLEADVFTSVNMTHSWANHSFKIVLCYASLESGGDDTDDYSAVAVQLNQVTPARFECQSCIAEQPRRTVINTPQKFDILDIQPQRGDTIMWMRYDKINQTNCSDAVSGNMSATGSRTVIYSLATSQLVTLHQWAEPGTWHLCMRPSASGLWSLVNNLTTHHPVTLTIDLDTAPKFSGTGFYYMADSSTLTFQDMAMFDPDHVYETKNIFLLNANCTNGSFTLVNQTGLTLLGGNTGISTTDLSFTATHEAANTAIASIQYTSNGRVTARVSMHMTDLGSVTVPKLTDFHTIDTQYDCLKASPPRVAQAIFDDAIAKVIVTFDRLTEMGGLPQPGAYVCGLLFDAASTSKFGSYPRCSFLSTTRLQILLSDGLTLQPGDELTWGRPTIRACGEAMTYTSGSFVVQAPANPERPALSPKVPSKIGSCDALELNAGSSSGYGGLPISYHWDTLFNLTEYNITSIPELPSTSRKVTLPTTSVQALSGKLSFRITVTDYLGQQSNSTVVVELDREPVPLVFIAGQAQTQMLKRAENNRLSGSIELSSCAKEASAAGWNYRWSFSSHPALDSSLEAPFGNTYQHLVIPKNTMSGGVEYTVRLTVSSVSNSSLASYTEARVTSVYSPIETAMVGGDARRVSVARDLQIQANCVDPDRSTDILTPAWTCAVYPKLTPCYTVTGNVLPIVQVVDASSSTLTVAKDTMPTCEMPNCQYVFSVVLIKGTRIAKSKSVNVELVAGLPPVVTISMPPELEGKTKVNPETALRLLGAATAESGATITYGWKADASLIILADDGPSRNTKTRLNSQNLVIKENILTQRVTYTFTLEATAANARGTAAKTLTVNAPPTSGQLIITPTTGVTGNTTFLLETSGWVDDAEDLPLQYAFEYDMSATSTHSIGGVSVDVSTTTVLPTGYLAGGAMNVYVKAVDQIGAFGRASIRVTVTNPPMPVGGASAYVADAMGSALADALASGDPAAVTGSVNSFAALLNQPKNDTEPESSEQLSQRKDLRAQMVNALSSAAAAVDVTDPSAVAGLVNSISSVVSQPSELSPETAAAAANLLSSMIPKPGSNAAEIDDSTLTAIAGGVGNLLKTDTDTAPAPAPSRRSSRALLWHPKARHAIQKGERYLQAASRRLLSTTSDSKYAWNWHEYSKLKTLNAQQKYNISFTVMQAAQDMCRAKISAGGGSLNDEDPGVITHDNMAVTSSRNSLEGLQNPNISAGVTAATTSGGPSTDIQLPSDILAGNGNSSFDSCAVVFGSNTFDYASNMTGAAEGSGVIANSAVTSYEFLGKQVANIPHPIMMTHRNSVPQTADESFASCRYFDYSSSEWSTNGCFTVSLTATAIVCACYHLSDFTTVTSPAVIPSPNIADPVGDAGSLLEADASYLIAGLILVGLVILGIIITVMLTNRYRRAMTVETEAAAKYMTERTKDKKAKNEELPSLLDYCKVEHSVFGIMFEKRTAEYGPVRRITVLLCQITSGFFASALWMQRGQTSIAQLLLAAIFSSVTSFPVYYFIRYLFLQISKISDDVKEAPAHVQAQFASKLKIITISLYTLAYLFVAFFTYGSVLMTVNFEPDESLGWCQSNILSVLGNAFFIEPITLVLIWLYVVKYNDLMNDDIISDASVHINEASSSQLGGLGLRFATSALKDGMRQGVPEEMNEPDEPDPAMPPMPKPVAIRPITPVRVETPRRPQTPHDMMPVSVPTLSLEHLPEPETPETTPSAPTPPPAAVAMQEIQRMREELKARAERAKLQVQAQAAKQQQLRGNASAGGLRSPSGSGGPARGGLPALRPLQSLRPSAETAIAADRLSGLMAQRRETASRAERLQGIALSPFERNTPAAGATRPGQPPGLSPLRPTGSAASARSNLPSTSRRLGPANDQLKAVPGTSRRRFSGSPRTPDSKKDGES